MKSKEKRETLTQQQWQQQYHTTIYGSALSYKRIDQKEEDY